MRTLPVMARGSPLEHSRAEPVACLQREFHVVAVIAYRPSLSCALRIRYWTVFLCSINCSAVVL